ncbi:MAG: hypothetical protein ACYDCG_13155 [Candidatus Acidiferrales bacterium]
MAFRKPDHVCLRFAAFLFLVQTAHSASVPARREQESSQQQQGAQQPANSATSPQPAPKRRKVWTNDDVISLRTPADVYLAEKAAQEAAAAEAAAKEAAEAKLVKEAGLTEKLPATVEETRKLIAAKQNQITDDQEALDRYTAELPNEPAEHKDRMQAEIKRIPLDLPKERLELKELQDHLEKLTKAQLNEAPVSPASPPPS